MELRKWQKDAEQFFFANNLNAIFSVPTGSGKTFFAIYILKKLIELNPNLRTLIISPTNVILDMWNKELSNNGFLWNKVGIYNGTCKEYSRITLTTTASVRRMNLKVFDLLIADEIHTMGTDTLLKVLEHKFLYKIGLSATPDREDFKHWKIYQAFDYHIYKYDIKQALDDDVLNKFEFYDIILELDKDDRMKYDELSIAIATLMRSVGSFESFLALPASDPRKARLMGLISGRKEIIWANKKKLDVVARLCKQYTAEDNKIIVFSQFNKVTNNLYYYLGSEGLKSAVFHSGIKQEERKKALDDFTAGKFKILLSTIVLDQGMNIPSIDVGIILAGNSTERQTIQRLGRCLRKKDKPSTLFQVYMKDTFEEEVAKTRTNFYKPLSIKYDKIYMDD
jgi:superfamily II DNA or RNA helicase